MIPKPDTGFTPADLITSIRKDSRTKLRAFIVLLAVCDFLMVGAAFLIAYNLRFILPTAEWFDPTGTDITFYSTIVYVLIPIWLILFYLFHLYDPAVLFGGHQEYTSAFNACTVGMMLVIVASYLDPTLLVARGWLLISWVLTVALVFIERFSLRRVVYALRRRGHFLEMAYVVGANSEGIAIAEQLISSPVAGVNIIGFLDDNIRPGEEVLPGVLVHGSTTRAQTLVRRFGVERLIVATSGVQREKLLDLFRSFVNNDEVSMWMSSGMYEILTTGVKVQDVGSVPMVSVNRVRLTGINVFMKAVLDYVGATLGLIALSPLFAAIYIAMKLTDPGPVFYRRRVVGVGGKEFDAFKFRTMVVNSQQVLEEYLASNPEARAEYEQYYKLKDDPRVTRIGRFLRKTSIDELPQLVNVLRREMSLVGPRMITMAEVEKYGKWGLNLQTVKPGITGLWQVSGRSDITYEERVRLDMRYIRNYSIWLDIQILVQTIPSVLFSKGAY
jgi:exopolysaccharide biosynthesis polyprenyl glycosylphosphotransferase